MSGRLAGRTSLNGASGPACEAENLTVRIGTATIVDSVSLSVAPGSWTTIIGPNGAGKTTLLRAVAGLVRASGTVRLLGAASDRMNRRERARRVAIVPQDPVIPIGMTVAHYVLLGRTAQLAPLARETDADLVVVDRALNRLDLDDLETRPIETLSGGERQRAVLARALVQDAPLLLLDEPTSALDIGHQQEVLALVDQLRRQLGLTVVATMHDLTLAALHADEVVLMRAGRVVNHGPPSTVLTTSNLCDLYDAEVEVIDHRGRLVVIPSPKEDQHART